MADLKFGNVTPSVGNIKLGSNDVSEIYQGTTKLWPQSAPPSPGEVTVCDLVWTNTNSTITATTTGGNIPIVTNSTDWVNAISNQQAAACYWDFDSNNAFRGLYYNVYATEVIQPPAGFRLPTVQDYNDLRNCVNVGSSYGQYDVTPIGNNYYGFYTSSLPTNPTFGTVDWNAISSGYVVKYDNLNMNFTGQGRRDIYWTQQTAPVSSLTRFWCFLTYDYGLQAGYNPGYLEGFTGESLNSGTTTRHGFAMRFVKDAPPPVELYDNDTQTGPTVSSIVEPRLSPVGNSGTYGDSAVDVGSVVIPAGGGYITFAQYLTNSTTPNITDAYFLEGRIRLYTTPQRNTFPHWDTQWTQSNQGGTWSPDGAANKKSIYIFLGQGTYYIRLGYLAQKPNPPGPAYQVTFNTAVYSGIQ